MASERPLSSIKNIDVTRGNNNKSIIKKKFIERFSGQYESLASQDVVFYCFLNMVRKAIMS